MKVLPTLSLRLARLLMRRGIVGCFFGCIATFAFGEKLGRRWSLAIGAVIMVIGAVLQSELSSAGTLVSAAS